MKFLKSIILPIFLLLSLAGTLFGQDVNYEHKIVKDLTDVKMFGRSAFKNGDSIAAKYIADEYKKIKLKSFNDNYFQYFTHPSVQLEECYLEWENVGNRLKPEDNYFIFGFSPSCDITIENEKPIIIDSKEHWELIKKTKLKDIILVFNYKMIPVSAKEISDFLDNDFDIISPKLVIIQGYDNLSYYLGREALKKFPVIQLKGEPIGQTIKYLKLHIKNNFIAEHKTQNIIGYVEGKQKDKWILLTCHYDALGMFGNEYYFPGAQDNASGVAAILDLAKYFTSADKPNYSVAFICFGAEEIGLLGSKYFVDTPTIPLKDIKQVINLDLVGSGSEGLRIVNGDTQNKLFNDLKTISDKNKYFWKIEAAEHRCNSDHCPFVEKNVPAVFIMTAGKEQKYGHSIYDNYDNLPFTKTESLFKLLRDYLTTIK